MCDTCCMVKSAFEALAGLMLLSQRCWSTADWVRYEGSGSGMKCRRRALSRASAMCSASADPDPLGRAEHIVYAATFFNKEADAARLLSEITREYDSITTAPTASSPTVAWVSQSTSLFGFTFPNGTAITGPGFIFSFATYKNTLVKNAGANLLPVAKVAAAATEGAVRLADSMERGREVAFSAAVLGSDADVLVALQPLLQEVDILIDETFTFNISVVRTLPLSLPATV